MKINDLYRQLLSMNADIKKLIKEAEFDNYDDLSGVEIDADNINERFMREQLRAVMQNLQDASADLNYLKRDITGEYTLYKNGSGRYTDGVKEYSCGNVIEFCYYDDFDECDKWDISTVEHNGEDYYIVRHKKLSLEGLKVRRRNA